MVAHSRARDPSAYRRNASHLMHSNFIFSLIIASAGERKRASWEKIAANSHEY